MAKTIKTVTSTVVHDKCGKEIARVKGGVLHVQCLRRSCKQWVPLPGWVQEDPLAQYYRIPNLIVIGPAQIEKALLTSSGENPLDLRPGWCPLIPLPYSVKQMEAVADLCRTDDWATVPILWLALPLVGGKPTSLVNQYQWWGVCHDGKPPGKVRNNVFWSKWYIQSGPEYNFSKKTAVAQATWNISYELPAWSTGKSWDDQQSEAKRRGMTIAPVAHDALMMNLVLASTDRRLRADTWARTSTICGGRPLGVYCHGDGVHVHRYWGPDGASGGVGAALEGVPLELRV